MGPRQRHGSKKQRSTEVRAPGCTLRVESIVIVLFPNMAGITRFAHGKVSKQGRKMIDENGWPGCIGYGYNCGVYR